MMDVEISFIIYSDQWEESLAIREEVKSVYNRAIAGILEGNNAECCSGGMYGFEDIFN